MGICYKLFLEDEFDWGYAGPDKDTSLKEFESRYNGYIERIAEFDNFVIYNVEKAVPYTPERLKLIREYADAAYYSTDNGTGITGLDLPYVPNPKFHKEKTEVERAKEVRKKL